MTPDDLRDLPPEGLHRILDSLATARYGARWQTALAREFGYSRRGVHSWATEGRRVPVEMIIALHHLQHPPPVVQLGELAQLARLAKLTAERMESEISRLSPPEAAESEPSSAGDA
jgi:hypothetical protein